MSFDTGRGLLDPDLYVGEEPDDLWVRVNHQTAVLLLDRRDDIAREKEEATAKYGLRTSPPTLSDVVALMLLRLDRVPRATR